MGIPSLGRVYFGWGVLLAVTSVFVAPELQARLGTLTTMYAMLALIAAAVVPSIVVFFSGRHALSGV